MNQMMQYTHTVTTDVLESDRFAPALLHDRVAGEYAFVGLPD